MLLTLILSANVWAGHMPCHEDMEKFCKGMKGPEAHDCLEKHKADLSKECMDRRSEMHDQMQKQIEACKDDMKKFCADVKPGEGRKMECMKSHEKDLSQGCKDAHKAMHEKMGMKDHMDHDKMDHHEDANKK